ncbi:EAL domain-containing protein [Salipaludibacillus sp. HK11]|uniref:sensor domain-containing protein n=1 Tax=Salipaludibacillus sp. HK11 TaxID=3394320 RepID=UPI0039FD2A4A
MYFQNNEIINLNNFVKERILDIMSLSISILGLIFLIANLINELAMDSITLTYYAIPLYLILFSMYIFRRWLSYSLRAYSILSMVFLAGMGSMYFYGMIGPGMLFFLTATYMGTILLTEKRALLFMLVNLFTFVFIGFLWNTESLTFNFPLEDYATSSETFFLRIAAYIAFLSLIFLSQYALNKYLISSIVGLEGAQQEIIATEEELKSQNDEIKKKREAIQLSDKKYHVLVEHSKDLIYSLDAQGNLLSSNSAFNKMFGFDDSLVGKANIFEGLGDHDENVFSEFIRIFQKHFNEVLGLEKSVYFVGHLCDQNNDMRTLHIILSPVYDDTGNLYMITGQGHDVTNIIKKEEEIKHLAYYDQLSGLPNRIQFEEKVIKAIEICERDGKSIAMMFFDLDNFKKVNDTLGHQSGDLLLKKISKRVNNVLEDGEFLSRMGGDEFAILVKKNDQYNCFYDQLRNLSRLILPVLERAVRIHDVDFYLSASIGIVVYPDHASSFEQLMKNADTAMYEAKSLGKNQFQFYHSSMNHKIDEYIRLEAALREGFESGEIFIQYHPLVKSRSREVRGFEALMRWNSVTFGDVSPARFIPILEQTGMIIDYGEWIMREACEQTKKWNEENGKDFIISVNVSAIQFKHNKFAETVKNILTDTGLQPELLEIEITEGILIDDLKSVVEILIELKKIGVRVALDDFGTGYSSLNYLRQLPIDTLKIDKSFIDDIRLQNRPKMIIGSIISLAHEMGLEVVAEGIEYNDQAVYLEEKNCDWMQGFYFYFPLTKKGIEKQLFGN